MPDKIFPTDFASYVPTSGTPVVSADRILLYRNSLTDIVAMDPVAWYSTLSKPAPARIIVGNAANGDTIAHCNYLDTGNGAGVKAAVDAAVLSGVPTTVWVREGTYSFLAANMFTCSSLVSLRGVHRDRVLFNCPTAGGARQTLGTMAPGTSISDLTISLTANPAAIAGGPDFIGSFALYVQNSTTLQRVKFMANGAAGAGPVFAMVGREEAGAPQDITIEDVSFEFVDAGNAINGIVIGSTDAGLTTAPYALRAARISGVATGTLGLSGLVISEGPVLLRDTQQRGFGYTYSFTSTYTGAVTTIPPTVVTNVNDDVSGQAYQGYNGLTITGAGNPVLGAARISGGSYKANSPAGGGSIDSRMLRVVFDTVSVQGFAVEGLSFSGSGAATGGVEIRCVNAATFDNTLVSNITTKGLVRLATANPSIGPWTNTVISGVTCGDMTPPEYSQNLAITGCSISGTLSISNAATNTWIGASVRYGTYVDNGQHTHIGTHHHQAITSPLVTHDASLGYQIGDTWTNTVTSTWFVCSSNSVGAAVWAVILTTPTTTPGAFKSFGTNNAGVIGFYDPSLFESTVATVSGASATLGSEYLTRVTYAAALCALSGPASTTTWPVGVTKRVTKENTGAFGITFAPDSGGTVNGGAVNAAMTLPGSDAPSSTTTADRSWLITRTATSTWRVATFGLADATTSRSGLMSAADKTLIDAITSTSVTSPRFLGSANNTAAAPTFLVEPAGNSGLYWDATKGVVTSVDAVDRILARVNGTVELSTGAGISAGVPALRLVRDTADIQVFITGGSPEAAITGQIGDLDVAVTGGFLYIKRSGVGNTGWVLIDRCESGTYTATCTGITNIDSVSFVAGRYIRVGDVVHGAVRINVDPTTASVLSQVDISIPVASAFSTNDQASGNSGSTNASLTDVRSDATNDRLSLTFVPTVNSTFGMNVLFTYVVL